MNILYLHGFASSPHGTKVSELRRRLEPEGFRFQVPDLNAPSFAKLNFDAAVRRAVEEAKAAPPDVIVGSSLGALMALNVVRSGIRAPLVLIAPALGLAERWTERIPPGDPIPVMHHGEQREIPIHRAYFELMAKVDADGHAPPVPVTILMGRLDETVPFDRVRGVWNSWEKSGKLAKGSRFIEIPQGDHSLTLHIDQIADAIRAAAGGKKP